MGHALADRRHLENTAKIAIVLVHTVQIVHETVDTVWTS